MSEIELILLLFSKHFVVDFPLQVKYQWANKGTYGHLGGILHAGLHGIGTFFCLIYFGIDIALMGGYIDALLHYHIDWAKMNINHYFDLNPSNSEKFWWLLGFDQYLHSLTYIGITTYIFSIYPF